MCTVKILVRLRKCAGWPESSLGAHVLRYVFWRCDSYIKCKKYECKQTTMVRLFITSNSEMASKLSLTVPGRFLGCRFSFFLRQWVHMWLFLFCLIVCLEMQMKTNLGHFCCQPFWPSFYVNSKKTHRVPKYWNSTTIALSRWQRLYSISFKENWYIFTEDNYVQIVLPPFGNGIYSKKKAKSYRLE